MNKLLIMFGFLLTVGCSIMSRVNSVQGANYVSLSDASKKVTEVGFVAKNDWTRLEILENISPQINHEGTQDYFEVVAVEGVAGESFNFRSDAICDCLGFRKWIVNPKSYLFDDKGKHVEAKINEGPKHTEITGVYPYSGTFKLIIIAESKYVGGSLSNLNGHILGVPVSIPLTTHPVGELKVSSN